MPKYIVTTPLKYGNERDPEGARRREPGEEIELSKQEAEQLGGAVATPKEYEAMQQAAGQSDAEAMAKRIGELETENAELETEKAELETEKAELQEKLDAAERAAAAKAEGKLGV